MYIVISKKKRLVVILDSKSKLNYQNVEGNAKFQFKYRIKFFFSKKNINKKKEIKNIILFFTLFFALGREMELWLYDFY